MIAISVLFLVCAGLIMLGEIIKYFIEDEFDTQKFLGWACAGIWCIKATWV
jgi:hypothetical protein